MKKIIESFFMAAGAMFLLFLFFLIIGLCLDSFGPVPLGLTTIFLLIWLAFYVTKTENEGRG